jgi:hypothetical protein
MALAVRERPGEMQLGVQSVSIEGAIDHLVEAAQGVVENELELARLELEVTLRHFVQRAVLVLLGALLLGGAAVALAVMGYEAFPPDVPSVERLGVIAGVTGLLGLVLALLGLRSSIGRERP